MAFRAPQYDGRLGFTAQDLRQEVEAAIGGVGVIDVGDLLVSAGSGFNSSVAAGRATIRNTYLTTQGGLYLVRNDASVAAQHVSPDPSNPRVDQVFCKVYDSETGGDTSDAVRPVVSAGTASGSVSGTPATALDARTGVGSAPSNNYILLADIYVPAAAGSAASFTYRDRRPLATALPGRPATALNAVVFDPLMGISNISTVGAFGTNFNNNQISAAMYLPRRVVNATKIRWSYVQSVTTALTGNYNLAIYDSSGRIIVSIGSTAFTGATSSVQARSETIASTTFEAGLYYVCWGLAGMNGGGISQMLSNPTACPIVPNVVFASPSGGITMPTTTLAFLDGYTSGLQGNIVPVVALSQT